VTYKTGYNHKQQYRQRKEASGLYKVLIVDDDPHFVERIQTMVDWEGLGFQIVDIEILGIAGLGKFFSYEPNILLLASDVYIMRGEEFLRFIQKASHNYRVIYLNQGGVSIPDFPQVTTCIDKSTLTGETLAMLLKMAASQLESESESVGERLGVSQIDTFSIEKREVLQMLFDGMSTYKFQHYRKQVSLRLYDTDLVLAVYRRARDEDMHRRHCAGIAEILDTCANGEQITLENNIHCILFNLPAASIIIQNKACGQILEQILTVLADGEDSPIRLYAGSTIHMTALHGELNALRELMNYDYFTADSPLIRRKPQNIIALEDLIPTIDRLCQTIRQCIIQHDRTGLDQAMKELFFSTVKRSMNYSVRDMVRKRLAQMYDLQCFSHIFVSSQDPAPDDFDSLEQEHNWHHILFMQLLEALEYRGDIVHGCVQQAIEYIILHYRENISLAIAAQEIGVSKSYLCALFKQDVGIGFSGYLNKYRVSKAKELLVQDYSVKEISAICGYFDSKYFSRVFKAFTGKSPKRFQIENTPGKQVHL